MSSLVLPRPGVRLGKYPQKQDSKLTELELSAARFFTGVVQGLDRKSQNQNHIVRLIQPYTQTYQSYSEQQFTKQIQQLRYQIYRKGLQKSLIIQAFAAIREAASRTLNKTHYDEQLYAGWLMINGMLAEMQTGEGKTLATTLPACTAAFAGIPVHIITANDYLAERDANQLKPLYDYLGLSSGSVVEGMEIPQRQTVYQTDIVHTTNKQVAFDYLRDRIEMGDSTGDLKSRFHQILRQHEKRPPLLLRGLCFALIDEADSILIDEAKTPLIITKTLPNEEQPETYNDALFLASALFVNKDFTVDSQSHQIEFTREGENNLADLIIGLPKHWKIKHKRESLVKQALAAEYFYKKNKHYIIQDGKVQIVDEFTGRIMPDRSWEQGLHQMIEAKEGCLISDQREPLARISYQRFFSRYLKVAGTSGTLSEVSTELRNVYGLHVGKIHTHKPCKRHHFGEKVYPTQASKIQNFLYRIKKIHQLKRPILIGTTSVEESEQISRWLTELKLNHKVLNAKQDEQEAEIISQAGLLNAITVATNMAGRGTDIIIPKNVEAIGGLHVIAFQKNESKRIDRQLYGRCARQGDNGSAEAILSLTDPQLEQFYPSAMLKLLTHFCSEHKPLPNWLAKVVLKLAQKNKEKQQGLMRKLLLKQDKQLRKVLAIAGKFE